MFCNAVCRSRDTVGVPRNQLPIMAFFLLYAPMATSHYLAPPPMALSGPGSRQDVIWTSVFGSEASGKPHDREKYTHERTAERFLLSAPYALSDVPTGARDAKQGYNHQHFGTTRHAANRFNDDKSRVPAENQSPWVWNWQSYCARRGRCA